MDATCGLVCSLFRVERRGWTDGEITAVVYCWKGGRDFGFRASFK